MIWFTPGTLLSCLSAPDFFSLIPSVQEGQQLIQEKPELSTGVRRKLEEIRECWQDLESTTQAKARQLFEANKADLLVQSYESLDQRLGQLEGQLAYVDQGQDLTTVNKQLKKLHVCRIRRHTNKQKPLCLLKSGSQTISVITPF